MMLNDVSPDSFDVDVCVFEKGNLSHFAENYRVFLYQYTYSLSVTTWLDTIIPLKMCINVLLYSYHNKCAQIN